MVLTKRRFRLTQQSQVDLEMSFVRKEDIQELVEELCVAMWAEAGFDIPRPMRRMPYSEAMSKVETTDRQRERERERLGLQ